MTEPTGLRFPPRVLWLSQDPARVREQLAGRVLTRAEAGALRDEISTDEITPLPALVHFDDTLGRFVYTGFTAAHERPIGRDAVRAAGAEVVVAGARYGKGSSREHSPVAERAAGVRLVIADSFERIYRQNADNVGLLTSTDPTLAERILRGEPIALDTLLAGRDALAAAILRAGGLLDYGQAMLAGVATRADAPADGTAGASAGMSAAPRADGPAEPDPGPPAHAVPLTLFEKIVARHAIATPRTAARLAPGEGGFVRADWRFIHEYYTGMAAWMLERRFGDALALHDPAGIVTFEDHLSYVHASPVHVSQGLVPAVAGLSRAHRAFVARFGLRDHGYVEALEAGDPANQGSQGISHALMAERYALPGQLIAGTDSHTPHSGALGCVAFGVGTTDMANAFVTGAVRFTMPEVLRIEIDGPLPAGVTAKDVVLHLLADAAIRAGLGVGRVFEFAGDAVRAMRTDERATLTNMVAELGGFTGIVEPDDETARFVRERRGVAVSIEPWMRSDPGARYAATLRFDGTRLSPMVARPGDPGLGLPLAALDAPVPIDIAYGGSCTAGKREDFDHYHAVLDWAARRGLRVAPGVALFLQFGTEDVRAYCIERGYLAAFDAVGAEMLRPACGACANCGPGASTSPGQVTVSAVNRNFPGRSGPGSVWLASPPTVAASAILGRLASFEDLRREAGAA
jgi:3-isopropylmalate/(R)-2-methylmalate dehydratase large subunit